MNSTSTPSIYALLRAPLELGLATSSSCKTVLTALGLVSVYVALVRAKRWRRFEALHRRYEAKWARGELTPREAQSVVYSSALYDMPELIVLSLSFALFKTYAVPSISTILAATKELGSKKLISKRYADTEILISTFIRCPINGFFDLPMEGALPTEEADPRAMIALARINWLHSRYKITNDDYLFTLALFILEPQYWAARWGWRALSPMECDAYFIFWKEIGQRMGIKDIPDTLEELKAWSTAYEKEHMVPAQTNHDVAGYTTDELLHAVPERFGIKNFFRRLSFAVLDDHVRVAMMQPAQPWWMHAIVWTVLKSSAFFQRWFCLPRMEGKSVVKLEQPEGECPRLYPTRWAARPWYKPRSGGLQGLMDKLAVSIGFYDEMPGPHLKSEGYRLEELGPSNVEQNGHEDVMRMAGDMLGCPITGRWSLEHKK